MLFYIASDIHAKGIQEVIYDTNIVSSGSIQDNEVPLMETLKKDMVKIGELDQFIIDLNAVIDQDDEIIRALEMYRMMYNKTRIIILASGRRPGDQLLMQCFQMGIYDIIGTSDFNIIKDELRICITEGKTFKDSICFKDAQLTENVVIKNKIKKTLYKVLVGFTGTQPHIGVTHNCILLANFLRKNGFRVAICEVLPEKVSNSDYSYIRESFDEELQEDQSFSINNIDYYENMISTDIAKIDKPYNFIILDMGNFSDCDQITLSKCEVKFMVGGSKPYETPKINELFDELTKEALQEYQFIFNLVDRDQEKDIRQILAEFKVHFSKYASNPYENSDFVDGDRIFEEYLLNTMDVEKTGFFKNLGKANPVRFFKKFKLDSKNVPPGGEEVEQNQ